MLDLDERGHEQPKPYAYIPRGLAGDCTQSRLIMVDGLIWEFADYPNGQTRVFMHDPQDLKGNDQFDSYA